MASTASAYKFEAIRVALLGALGVAAATSCASRTVGESDAGSGSSTGASTSSTSESTGTSEDTGPVMMTGEAPTLCEPDPAKWQGILCTPKAAAACGECDEACQQSDEGRALAGEFGGCCFFSFNQLCGPVEMDGKCCYTVELFECGCEGRPLAIDGVRHTARAVRTGAWCGGPELAALELSPQARALAAARWTAAALDEHASIAAFARFSLQLLALGAPAELVAEASAALADEVEHARVSFAVASRLAGVAVGAGPLPAAVTGALSTSLVEVALATFAEGCVGETIAAASAGVAAARCADPGLRAVLRAIADDELRHAALAWRTLRWALQQPGAAGLREALAAVVAPARREGEAEPAEDLTAAGCLSPREAAAVADEAWRQVIAPCLQALLSMSSGTCAEVHATRERAAWA